MWVGWWFSYRAVFGKNDCLRVAFFGRLSFPFLGVSELPFLGAPVFLFWASQKNGPNLVLSVSLGPAALFSAERGRGRAATLCPSER
jgi:hypothetical protein